MRIQWGQRYIPSETVELSWTNSFLAKILEHIHFRNDKNSVSSPLFRGKETKFSRKFGNKYYRPKLYSLPVCGGKLTEIRMEFRDMAGIGVSWASQPAPANVWMSLPVYTGTQLSSSPSKCQDVPPCIHRNTVLF